MILAATDYAPVILAAATLFTSIVTGIIALGSWFASLKNKAVIEKVSAKVETTSATVDKVEVHVNSDAAAKLAKIESQALEIRNLTGLLAERKATAELLAQSDAIAKAAAAAAPVAAPALEPTPL